MDIQYSDKKFMTRSKKFQKVVILFSNFEKKLCKRFYSFIYLILDVMDMNPIYASLENVNGAWSKAKHVRIDLFVIYKLIFLLCCIVKLLRQWIKFKITLNIIRFNYGFTTAPL